MADDLDAFMKDLGVPSGGSAKTPAAKTKPDAKGAEPEKPERDPRYGRAPTYDEMGWQAAAGQGVAKGLATLGTEIPQFGNNVIRYFSPSLAQNLGDLANRIPGVKGMQEFADAPYEGPAERVGSYLTQGVGMMAGPPVGKLGQLAKQGVNWAFPPVFRGAGRGAMGTGWGVNPTLGRAGTRTAMKVAQGAGNTAEAAGRGALAGAIANPDEPGAGATVGAIGGPAGRVAGSTLRTPMARWAAQLGLTEGAYYALHKQLGIPYYPILGPAIIWHSSPVGRSLRRVANRIVDTSGRVLGTIRPEVAGYAASSAQQALAPGTSLNDIISNFRPAPEESNDETGQERQGR